MAKIGNGEEKWRNGVMKSISINNGINMAVSEMAVAMKWRINMSMA
jgi:hypothetical protein